MEERRKKPQGKNIMSAFATQGAIKKARKCGTEVPRDGRRMQVCKNGMPLSAAFLVPRRKVWLAPTARVPCSNADDTGECKSSAAKYNVHICYTHGGHN